MKPNKKRSAEGQLIQIENVDSISIYYNCCKDEATPDVDCEEEEAREEITDCCVPLRLGSKNKQARKYKLDKLAKSAAHPSVIATSFFQLIKRYTEGKEPSGDLEKVYFRKMDNASPRLKEMIKCTSKSYQSVQSSYSNVFDPGAFDNTDTPITFNRIENLLVREFEAAIKMAGTGDTPGEERPGHVRLFEYGGGDDVFPSQVHIFKVNGLRTNEHPQLTGASLLPEETQRDCSAVIDGEEVTWDCENKEPPCDGHQLGNTCLAVPIVQAGTSVTIEGVNFFDIDAKIKFRRKGSNSPFSEVDAFVYGDVDTPVTEIIDGEERLIADHRVRDKIFFTIPATTEGGIIELFVSVPNSSGFNGPGFSDFLTSSFQYLEVIPSPDTRYQIVTEELFAKKETSPAWMGSDEVGIRVLSIPIFPNNQLGSIQEKNFRFGDVDSGNRRDMNQVVFNHTNPVSGLILSVIGFEIDSNDAYNEQVNDWTDLFIEYVKDIWDFILGSAVIGAIVTKAAGAGFWGYVAIAGAALVTLAIASFVALWAPADLIIEDKMSYSQLDLGRITNVNVPAPTANPSTTLQTSSGGIKLRLMENSKSANEYREERGYLSDEEDSWYTIKFRLNRIS
jgi:hypothetical protein